MAYLRPNLGHFYGLFKGLFGASFMDCFKDCFRFMVLLLDYVMTCMVVVVR